MAYISGVVRGDVTIGTVTIDYPTAQSSGYVWTYINDDLQFSRNLTINS
jgi:hypothetical protein